MVDTVPNVQSLYPAFSENEGGGGGGGSEIKTGTWTIRIQPSGSERFLVLDENFSSMNLADTDHIYSVAIQMPEEAQGYNLPIFAGIYRQPSGEGVSQVRIMMNTLDSGGLPQLDFTFDAPISLVYTGTPIFE